MTIQERQYERPPAKEIQDEIDWAERDIRYLVRQHRVFNQLGLLTEEQPIFTLTLIQKKLNERRMDGRKKGFVKTQARVEKALSVLQQKVQEHCLKVRFSVERVKAIELAAHYFFFIISTQETGTKIAKEVTDALVPLHAPRIAAARTEA